MKNWQQDLLYILEKHTDENEVFKRIEAAATALGFEHCAYGIRIPIPVTKPKILMFNNYPAQWRERYMAADYIRTDPTVRHGKHSREPLVWDDKVFEQTPELWEEARSYGLSHGWAQSSLDSFGIGGMLTLARSHEPLSGPELRRQEQKMRWLVNIAHLSFSSAINARHSSEHGDLLTERELEVLKWSADGKSAHEISIILSLSKNTVDFHIKNAIAKLHAPNKTAAVVRAVMRGLLY
jgi:DNA-binding CsgD family transcriptional regulator